MSMFPTGSGKPTFLEQFHDPSVKAVKDFDYENFHEVQVNRLMTLAHMAYNAKEIKRRLGQEASPNELARDKRVCKKLYNRWRTVARIWGLDYADTEEYILQHAQNPDPPTYYRHIPATVDWHALLTKLFSDLRQEVKQLASQGMSPSERPKASSFANRLINEIAQINQIWEEIYPENPLETD